MLTIKQGWYVLGTIIILVVIFFLFTDRRTGVRLDKNDNQMTVIRTNFNNMTTNFLLLRQDIQDIGDVYTNVVDKVKEVEDNLAKTRVDQNHALGELEKKINDKLAAVAQTVSGLATEQGSQKTELEEFKASLNGVVGDVKEVLSSSNSITMSLVISNLIANQNKQRGEMEAFNAGLSRAVSDLDEVKKVLVTNNLTVNELQKVASVLIDGHNLMLPRVMAMTSNQTTFATMLASVTAKASSQGVTATATAQVTNEPPDLQRQPRPAAKAKKPKQAPVIRMPGQGNVINNFFTNIVNIYPPNVPQSTTATTTFNVIVTNVVLYGVQPSGYCPKIPVKPRATNPNAARTPKHAEADWGPQANEEPYVPPASLQPSPPDPWYKGH